MNTLLYIKNYIVAFLYQGPLLPAEDSDMDSVPIDDYLVVGLIAGILMIVLFTYMQKTKVSNKISK